MNVVHSGQSAKSLADWLARVETIMVDQARRTVLSQTAVEPIAILGAGKRLRARLALRAGLAAGSPPPLIAGVAAAVEMVHAASLLHDDVIDGGELRRGAPAFWVRHGVPGAILVGDLVLCAAYDVIRDLGSSAVLHALVEHTREMCEAEVEQELLRRGRPAADWAEAERAARRKTGALFAFAAFGAAGANGPLADALREAGYLAGTAYQLSDDVLDVTGDAAAAGKTLGRDVARGKNTAATVCRGDPRPALRRIAELREQAERRLADWPDALDAFREYWLSDLEPAMCANTRAALANIGASS